MADQTAKCRPRAAAKRTPDQDDALLPEVLPQRSDLRTSLSLGRIFDDCHNHVYANEGLLKERIFHEMLKVILMKLVDEETGGDSVQFGITAGEYRDVVEGKSGDFQQRMARLYQASKQKCGSLVRDDAVRLRPNSLAFIVARLQWVDIQNTPRDVKGEAFQSFVNRNQRGDRGEFFTPLPIVRLATALTELTPQDRVIDPACGSGGFLLEALAQVSANSPKLDRAEYIRTALRGIEFNPDVALSATLRIVFEGGAGTEILCANALTDRLELDEQFDVVLTNPPFGSKGKLEERQVLESYALAHRWSENAGQWRPTSSRLAGQTPEILFLERSLRLLRPGGRIAVVLPDGLLQNSSSAFVRAWLRQNAKILGVVSIPQEAFVPYGTGIKTSVLVAQKLPSSFDFAYMGRIAKVGYDVKGQPVFQRDASGKVLAAPSGEPMIDEDVSDVVTGFSQSRKRQAGLITGFTVSEDDLDSRLDVDFYDPQDMSIVDRLGSGTSLPLRDVADILETTSDFRDAGSDDIRYIAISDVDARTMQVVSMQTMKAHEAPSRATYRVQTGDIITAVSGASTGTPRQATAQITEEHHGAICSNGFAVIRNIRGVDPFFLLAFFRTDYFLRQVKRKMTGHAIPCISLDELGQILVPIPPPSEQRRVAATAGKLQDMRRQMLGCAAELDVMTQRTVEAMLPRGRSDKPVTSSGVPSRTGG